MPPSRTRLPRVCGGGRSIARVRSPTVVRRSPKPSAGQEMGFLSADKSSRSRAAAVGDVDDDDIEGFGNNNNSSSSNKVMVVVDSSVEAKAALEWALSHTLQTHDSLILLFVAKPPPPSSNNRRQSTVHSNVELLYSMKNLCQRKRPGVQVEVIIREGENRGPIIVEEAKRQRVSLLVLGHRKQRVMWRLIHRLKSRVGGRRGGGEAAAVKYCIHNSSCMTIAVRRQGKKLGGYLITTKRHNNFWLLA
ncbi:unnamed protein product [Linum tenue]|uniref:UspA domain-containing protein n=1 Tax=Linum tenue TaxID=586396 RepID=A0AAV0KYW2_9ROSI|nr:unnamed protein product [Linum tenue]